MNMQIETRSDLPAVRLANYADEPEIMAMCRRLHDENGLFDFSEDKVRSCIKRYYDRAGTIIGVIGETGAVEATTCILFSGMYYTDAWHLAELWNYVQPEYRSSKNAQALIEFGKKCSREIGVPYITGIITNNRLMAKVRLYRRLLGQPCGAFFVYNGAWTNDNTFDTEFWDKQLPLHKTRRNGVEA